MSLDGRPLRLPGLGDRRRVKSWRPLRRVPRAPPGRRRRAATPAAQVYALNRLAALVYAPAGPGVCTDPSAAPAAGATTARAAAARITGMQRQVNGLEAQPESQARSS